MTDTTQQEREAFEAWDRKFGEPRDWDKNGRDEYTDERTQERFDAWQAARATPQGAEPVADKAKLHEMCDKYSRSQITWAELRKYLEQ